MPSHHDTVSSSHSTAYFDRCLTLIALGPTLIYFVYAQLTGWRHTHTQATGIFKWLAVMRHTTAVNEQQWHPALAKHQMIGVKIIDDDVFA
jgi:hypothetical protein